MTVAAIGQTFRQCLAAAQVETAPYRYWLLRDALPAATAEAITALPWTPATGIETYGKRETNNASRCYFGLESQQRHPVCAEVAAAFQAPETTAAIAATCGVTLAGSSLRIEYCQDTEGFWLEPHTDIGVKRFTMLIYLSQGPGADTLGTDVLDDDHRLVATAPSGFGRGLIFIPAANTWHAFHRRPIPGIRKSIIVNYVGPEWRARHELCFPETPVAG